MATMIKLLYDYFPTAIYNGKSMLFVSESWKVELTELPNTTFGNMAKQPKTIRVKIYKKALNGEFIPGHYEDFYLDNISEMAEQIEKYIQSSVGSNIREGN